MVLFANEWTDGVCFLRLAEAELQPGLEHAHVARFVDVFSGPQPYMAETTNILSNCLEMWMMAPSQIKFPAIGELPTDTSKAAQRCSHSQRKQERVLRSGKKSAADWPRSAKGLPVFAL